MAHFRLEAVLDSVSNLYSLKGYYPAESTTPFVTTLPRFHTEEEAFNRFKTAFNRAFPDKEPARDLKPN